MTRTLCYLIVDITGEGGAWGYFSIAWRGDAKATASAARYRFCQYADTEIRGSFHHDWLRDGEIKISCKRVPELDGFLHGVIFDSAQVDDTDGILNDFVTQIPTEDGPDGLLLPHASRAEKTQWEAQNPDQLQRSHQDELPYCN